MCPFDTRWSRTGCATLWSGCLPRDLRDGAATISATRDQVYPWLTSRPCWLRFPSHSNDISSSAMIDYFKASPACLWQSRSDQFLHDYRPCNMHGCLCNIQCREPAAPVRMRRTATKSLGLGKSAFRCQPRRRKCKVSGSFAQGECAVSSSPVLRIFFCGDFLAIAEPTLNKQINKQTKCVPNSDQSKH